MRIQNPEFRIQEKQVVRSYRDLKIWQRSMQLVTEVYALMNKLEEKLS